MENKTKQLTFKVKGTGDEITLKNFHAFVAGYTGRDTAAVQQHIDELAEIGVPAPKEIPTFYSVTQDHYDTSGKISKDENLTSGEVEPVYIRHAGKIYLGVGSDHTDRDLETEDIAASKLACAKPVSYQVIAVDDISSLSLDECTARSWVDNLLYQEGKLSGLRTPKNVVDLLIERTDVGDDDFICLGGTLPLLEKKFKSGGAWRVQLELPNGEILEHTYTVN
ncbi:hypothetical protein BTW10_00325 [Chromohalobacter japonicus]|uniref:DUF2848 domain-containing protein n=1 Tax=Chromohalobacter japonicus TaxID=223900 RepID=A0A1Q8THT8_9GAMM|nr:DUF2848 family protein [Chromohalobacter japonicus]OLO13259.1 hypothetical protein BTW10_00325 [Chromohalobacter japonicus]